jgi:hypothetical protein
MGVSVWLFGLSVILSELIYRSRFRSGYIAPKAIPPATRTGKVKVLRMTSVSTGKGSIWYIVKLGFSGCGIVAETGRPVVAHELVHIDEIVVSNQQCVPDAQ